MQKDIEKVTEAVDKLFGSEDTKMEKKERHPEKTVSFDLKDDAVLIKLSLGEGVSDFNVSAQNNLLTVEIPEKNKKLMVGYNKKNGLLTIGTEYSKKEEKKEEGLYERHESFGRAERIEKINIPIDLKETKLRYKDGVLIISIPKIKIEEKKAKKLTVET